MKILHTADLHLASPLASLLPPDKREVRLRELNDVFFSLVHTAREEGVRAVLLCGDIFDSEAVTELRISDFLSEIKSNPRIDFFYVSGNHEKSILKNRVLPTNLHIFCDKFKTHTIEDVTFTGSSRIYPGMFEALDLPISKKNILLLHGSAAVGASAEIPLPSAKGKHIDYLALGHYHSYTVLPIDARGVAVYAGVPEGRGFDETGEKGCILIDTASGRAEHRFLRTAKRCLREVCLDLSDLSDTAEIERLAAERLAALPQNDLVRLTLTGETAEGLSPPTAALRYRFSDSFFYFEIKDKALPRAAHQKGISPLRAAFIASCEADDGLCEADRLAVMRMGLAALNGEDIPRSPTDHPT